VCDLCATADSLVGMERSSNVRAAASVALLGTGLLAGALFYGWANVTPTFAAVPLDVHLTFRVELMNRNAVVVQALMAVSFAAAAWLTIAAHGRVRACAACATALTAATFLVTRFGNVPYNEEMRQWLAGALAADYEQQLQVWGVFNDVRVATAVGAFALLIAAVTTVRTPQAALSSR
jgi:uncharacterized membrane protein